MRGRWLVPFVALGIVAAALVVIVPGRASDHGDALLAAKDPQSDITDVFAFMRPEPLGDGGYAPSKRAVFIMNLNPGATAQSLFDEKIDYVFRVRPVTTVSPLALSPQSFPIVCHASGPFDGGPQRMTCNAAGQFRTVDVNSLDGGPDDAAVRLFAGLRSDPEFADMTAFTDTINQAQLRFRDAAVNTYQNANVMSIVVDVDVHSVFNPSDAGNNTPILAVAVDTKRNE